MNNQTAFEDLNTIRELGIEALTEKLGPIGMVRFMQQYDNGSGDYTKERHKWLDKLSIEDICNSIEQKKKE